MVPSSRAGLTPWSVTGVVTAATLGLLCCEVPVYAQSSLAANTANKASTAVANEPKSPVCLNVFSTAWQAKGTGTLRFLGYKVYDATLWSTSPSTPFGFTRMFALDIRYNTSVKAADIVNTSLIEMVRISGATSLQVEAWSDYMKRLFPDVNSGDRLVGVHLPESGARFFLNDKLIGESTDVAFSEAFFKIWLDPKTRRPDLRSSLLGLGIGNPSTPGNSP